MDSFSLKEFREKKLKMSQEQFATTIGERQDTVSRWEQGDSDDIPVGKLKVIAQKFGQTLDQLLDFKKLIPKALNTLDTWKSYVSLFKEVLVDYLSSKHSKDWEFYMRSPEILTEYQNILDSNFRKPLVAFIGQSDVGKSTIINALVGEEKLPVAWTPTTAITVYIKHISDRPSFISEDTWIFKTDGTNKGFDLSTLKDEKRCRELCVAKGGPEILSQYGTRQGKHKSEDIVAAVLYVESEILRNVDLVDLPGFGTGDREADDIATRNISTLVDAVVYLSRANGFLSGGDETACLRLAIQGLPCFEKAGKNDIPPLGNLFIVASQAHTVNGGNEYELRNILNTKCVQFERMLPGTTAEFFEERSKLNGYPCEKYLQSRFFTYSTDIPSLCTQFEDNLRLLVENLPKRIAEQTKDLLRTFAAENGQAIDADLEGFSRLLQDKEQEEAELERIISNEPSRKRENEIKHEGIINEIYAYNEASLAEFSTKYSQILSVEHIVSAIKKRGFKKKKEDLMALSNFISGVVENALRSTLTNYSKKLKDRIDEYISDFEDSCNVEGKLGVTASIPFNAKRAFASGLTGVATFGGLAVWASALGNLGAYIIVAKGVSLLTALGITFAGGTAPVMASVAAIGGPIVLGIALAVIAALGVFAVLSGGWEKKVAKKLIDSYDEADATEKYCAIIRKFWLEDTLLGFNSASDKMENDWQELICNKKALVDNYDIEDIERRIKFAREMKHFLSNIPL